MPLTTAEDWKNALDNVGMSDFFKDTQIPDGVDGVLDDGNWEVVFHVYAQSEFSAENLDFLRAVAAFESSGSMDMGKEIYNTFVSADAATQVNLSGGVKGSLDEIFEAEEPVGPPDLFDGAKGEIRKMLGNDTFRRFKDAGTRAQTEMGEGTDWDNVEGRERS